MSLLVVRACVCMHELCMCVCVCVCVFVFVCVCVCVWDEYGVQAIYITIKCVHSCTYRCFVKTVKCEK